ncbi:integrin beta-nu [Colletes gigas]|uniref:integrin beta-nu n=1 Tax=Colletes gigas TaxID=935657 RepID=UPI001C9AAD82|nr:integrin beta-nu [Colletes gigas]XP_043264501.1 integrin beta-nu [Colletes gigas]
MRRIFVALLFVIVLCYEWKQSEAVDVKILKQCISQSSCESCLEASSSCAWCSDWSYSTSILGKPRCNVPEKLKAFGCPPEEIRTAPPGSIKILENFDFRDMDLLDETPLQLKPQKVKLRIRPNTETTVPLHYRPAKNYPLDLYYLMDLTWSMRDDKETLVMVGWNMTRRISKFNTNFRLGFGSYADKPLMPYIFPGHEDNPCKSDHAVCAPIYSFQHHLELTRDVQRFIKEVNDSLVTGNVDNLEGGLDGIVQAIVCTEEVGWNRHTRKIMLVATDGYLHFAGDGKLGGAVNRQDFKCHLDERRQYSLSTNYDYASLAEVSRLLQENKVNLIFAVTEDRRPEYELIADLLKEKARVATLTSNSSNILDIIETAYHDLISRLVLRDNSSSPLRLEYFSNCGRENNPESSTSTCDGIQEDHVYDFRLVFSFDKCPSNQSLWTQTVVVEDALASEVSEMVIEVELLCGCNCKDSEISRCQHGTNECGLCKCDFGWSGEHCDCDEISPVENKLQCISPNATKVCSERGECVCGICYCDKGYNGQFCECSACDKIGGIECSDRGTCECGVCNCLEGWQGEACQCPSTDDLCIAPGTQEICAGHGYCDCGECRCNVTAADDSYYRGTYCESSASAGGSGLCSLYNSCVNATVENPEEIDQYCRTNATVYTTETVDSVDFGNEHYCFVKLVKDKQTCNIHYVYEFQKNNAVVLKIGKKACTTPIHPAAISLVLVGIVVLIGIVCLLTWKCWTSIIDRKEYEKFEQEQKKTVYSLNENPLFRPAITRFRVPSMYKED